MTMSLDNFSLFKTCHQVACRNISQSLKSLSVYNNNSSMSLSSSSFSWDDVLNVKRRFNLNKFLDKIHIGNRGFDKQHEFISFVIGDQTVGYVHTGFTDHLKRFGDVFVFNQENQEEPQLDNHVTVNPMLRTAEERTSAVADVVRGLGEELIPGIRNELHPVSSFFGAPIHLSLERAAAPYFGIKAAAAR